MPLKYEISPLKLWSPLHRQLAACGQAKATPEQWIGTIRNLQTKGVSTAEIEWSGILEYLADQADRKIPLQELLDGLAIEPPCELRLQRLIADDFSPTVRYVKQPRPDPLPEPSLRKSRREVCLLQYKDLSFGICVWLHVEVDWELSGERFKYWTITVPRGKKHPLAEQGGKGFTTGTGALSHGRELVRRMAQQLASRGFVGQAESVNQFAHWVLAAGDHYTEWLITAPNVKESYFGPHFDVRNLVAHVRTTERTNPQGKRLLVLEEIQSDWNQERIAAQRQADTHPENAEDGFDGPTPPANPYEHHWLDAALRMMLLVVADKGLDGIGWLPGKLHAERFPWAKAEGLVSFYDQIVAMAVAKLAKPWDAALNQAEFGSYSRNYRVGKKTQSGPWRIFKSDSNTVLDQEFEKYSDAEVERLLMENHVLEVIPVFLLPEKIKRDVIEKGLPMLGAIGKRCI